MLRSKSLVTSCPMSAGGGRGSETAVLFRTQNDIGSSTILLEVLLQALFEQP